MKEHARVVVIGGGIVGAAVIYHLTKLGWSDVVLVERKQLTAGSTWHAAGGFHAMNSDPNVARLQAYGISVYKEVEKISGQDVGMHLTGGINIAATSERWEVAASVPLFIVVVEDNSFDLYLDRSYANYLRDWLRHSSEDPITRDAKTLKMTVS